MGAYPQSESLRRHKCSSNASKVVDLVSEGTAALSSCSRYSSLAMLFSEFRNDFAKPPIPA